MLTTERTCESNSAALGMLVIRSERDGGAVVLSTGPATALTHVSFVSPNCSSYSTIRRELRRLTKRC